MPSIAKKLAKSTTPPARLLAGGNPQISKGYGDDPVQAYIAAMPGWKSAVGGRLDQLIVQAVPEVCKAVKWNSPFYGVEGLGWFLAFHCSTTFVSIAFFRGQSLYPLPPGPSKSADTRYYKILENTGIDETQFVDWVRQARLLPGEKL